MEYSFKKAVSIDKVLGIINPQPCGAGLQIPLSRSRSAGKRGKKIQINIYTLFNIFS